MAEVLTTVVPGLPASITSGDSLQQTSLSARHGQAIAGEIVELF